MDNEKYPNDQESRPKKFLKIAGWTVLWVLALAIGLAITIKVLGHYSHLLGANSDPVAFVTGNLLNALILAAIVAQVLIYRKQWHVMERSFAVGTRAYMEVHSIETNDTGLITVKIENIGQIPATNIVVACKLDAFKDKKRYKPYNVRMDYERLSRGNFKIEFNLHLGLSFTQPEIDLILGRWVELPVFLEFRIDYFDGFKGQVSRSMYGYIGKPRNIWLPFAAIKAEAPLALKGDAEQNKHTEKTKEEKP